jgi:hypothetical protein
MVGFSKSPVQQECRVRRILWATWRITVSHPTNRLDELVRVHASCCFVDLADSTHFPAF